MRHAVALLALLTVAAPGSRALAATADGAMITNVATATYQNLALYGFAVSYSASAYVMVSSPNVQLQKTVSPTVACSGGTVTFCIFAVNTSLSSSAFNVTLWDKYTTEYAYEAGGQAGNWTNTTGSAITKGFVYGTISGPGQVGTGCAGTCPGPFPYSGATPCPCPDNWTLEPPAGSLGPTWMKWVVNTIGPGKSAMVCFRLRIQ